MRARFDGVVLDGRAREVRAGRRLALSPKPLQSLEVHATGRPR